MEHDKQRVGPSACSYSVSGLAFPIANVWLASKLAIGIHLPDGREPGTLLLQQRSAFERVADVGNVTAGVRHDGEALLHDGCSTRDWQFSIIRVVLIADARPLANMIGHKRNPVLGFAIQACLGRWRDGLLEFVDKQVRCL